MIEILLRNREFIFLMRCEHWCTPPASAARLVFGRSSFGELEPNPHGGGERNRPPRALSVDVAQVLLDEPIDIRRTVHPTQLGLAHSMLQTILAF